MIVLALDIATSLGWACGPADAPPVFGTEILPAQREGEDETRRLVRMGGWLEDMVEVYGIRHVVCEAPVPPGKMQNATQWSTTLLLLGLVSVAKATAMRMGCSHNVVPAPTWRKHFVGFGNSDKDDALKRNHQLGFMPATKDASDALGVLSYELHRLRRTPTWDDRDDRGRPVLPFPSRDPVQLPPPSERAGLRKVART